MKILAVDDEPIFLDLLRATLYQLGFDDVETASSGSDAIRMIQEPDASYDCFLLDIQMPEMDGVELCRNIRVLPSYRRTPIVMNTILGEKSSIDAAFSAGATDYLTKPINKVEIRARLGMVRNLVEERQRNEAASALDHGVQADSESVRFAYPLEMTNVAGAIDFLALKNYLRTLGKMRAFSLAGIGFHVVNAHEVFATAGPANFSETMCDIGSCIADSMKRYGYMMAYTGKGNFVCLTSRLRLPNSEVLMTEITGMLSEFGTLYAEFGIDPPQVAVGSPVFGSLFSMAPPTEILLRAIVSAQAEARHYSDSVAM